MIFYLICLFTSVFLYLNQIFSYDDFLQADINMLVFTFQSIIYILVVFILMAALGKFLSSKLNILYNLSSGRRTTFMKTSLIFFIFFVICLIPLTVTYLQYYPGGVSQDCMSQWRQINNFRFNDWHPVMHTLLIYPIARISGSYAVTVYVQMLIYTFGLAYLFTLLYLKGVRLGILYTVFFILVINSQNRKIMTFLWKDCALTIFVLYITIMLVKIYYSKGEYLSGSWKNTIIFSIVVGVGTLVRHNAFFYTYSLLVLIFILYYKQPKIKIILPLALLITASIRFPIYKVLKVSYPQNKTAEAVGMPMSIMSSVYKLNSSSISAETEEFLLSVSPRENYEKYGVIGDFNSVKFKKDTDVEVINNTPILKILEMTFDTIKSDKRNSFIAIGELTDIVWSFSKQDAHFKVEPFIVKNEFDIEADEGLNIIGERFSKNVDYLEDLLPADLLYSVGFHMLILLLCMVVTYKNSGVDSLIFLLPILAYNFGTMLLLCGADHRFFHFNLITTYPICLVLIFIPQNHKATDSNI